MNLGERILAKVNGQIRECIVIKTGYEDLDLFVESGITIRRKFWEIRKIKC